MNNYRAKEFRVNDFITLKFEGRRTNIYVNGQRFQQCMYLLLNIPVDRIEEYDDIRSIDEAAARLNRKMERNHNIISPEEEFMGHCSNIQTWAENNYDTRILHRNLAFPLLKKLTELGDPLAKRKFKEEIALRFASGHKTVITFLRAQGYLNYLTAEEFESMLDDLNPPILEEIATNIKPLLNNIHDSESKRLLSRSINRLLRVFRFNHGYLILLPLLKGFTTDSRQKLVEFLYNKFKRSSRFPLLKFLEKTLVYFNDIKLNFVKYNNKLLGILIDKKLDLKSNNIEFFADIEGLKPIENDIEELDLSDNQISEIKGLENLTNLKVLRLKNNFISEIKGLNNLKKLEILDLSNNFNITEIPENLNDLTSLKIFKLTGCPIKDFSDSASRFFWTNQNYRYYSNYTNSDVKYYEKTHKGKALANNKLYKSFVKWVFKIRSLRSTFRFSYDDIEIFESNTLKSAIHSGKLTSAFKKWLNDRYQTRITSFI